MLTVKLKNLTLEFCFGFFLTVGVMSLTSEKVVLYSLLFCLLHEVGHLLAMTINGVDVQALKFYGGGIKISAADLSLCSLPRQLIVYFAGCVVNCVLACIFLLTGMTGLALINLALCVFNLLPMPHLDGGVILHLFFENCPLERILSVLAYAVQSAFMLIMLAFSFVTYDYKSIAMFILMFLCSAFE